MSRDDETGLFLFDEVMSELEGTFSSPTRLYKPCRLDKRRCMGQKEQQDFKSCEKEMQLSGLTLAVMSFAVWVVTVLFTPFKKCGLFEKLACAPFLSPKGLAGMRRKWSYWELNAQFLSYFCCLGQIGPHLKSQGWVSRASPMPSMEGTMGRRKEP